MIFNSIQRFRHSRGYGVHSPFAFNFITNVVYEKHWYYAFTDIEYLLMEKGIDIHDFSFHHLSYRLVRYFKPKSVLELGFENTVNTLFICHSDKDIVCFCKHNANRDVSFDSKLINDIDREVKVVDCINSIKVDSIFVYVNNTNVEKLFHVSNEDAFWVLRGIDSLEGRKLWKSIVNDDRVSVTFNKKDIGIVLLNKSYKKQNYLI